MRFLVGGAVVLTTIVLSSSTFGQTPAPTDPAAAREQLKIGFGLSQEGKCAEAIPHFVESLRLDAKAITLLNLANCEEQVGRLATAMGHWVDARSRAQIDGARPIEEEAEKRIAALEPRLPRLTIVPSQGATEEGVVVERDGVVLGPASLNVPLPVDPGQHTIIVKMKGRQDAKTEVTLAEAEAKRIEVSPSDAIAEWKSGDTDGGKTSSGVSPLVWAGFGVALAGTAVGTVTGLIAFSAGRDAETQCPDGHCRSAADKDAADSGKTMGVVSTVAFIVAGVGAGVGIYGLASGPAKKPEAPPTPSAKLGIFPGGLSLRGTF